MLRSEQLLQICCKGGSWAP